VRLTITAANLVRGRINERSAFTATANFYDDTASPWSTSIPTSAKYRIDAIGNNPACSTAIVDWTALSAAASISIPVTSANNALIDSCRSTERHQLTVKANDALSTQVEEAFVFDVVNLAGT
jgi:hypothetical protein